MCVTEKRLLEAVYKNRNHFGWALRRKLMVLVLLTDNAGKVSTVSERIIVWF